VPARPLAATQRPGSYPIRVTLDGGRYFDVTSDDAKCIDQSFRWLSLTGGEQGDTWKVQLLETRDERVYPPGQRGSVPVTVQAPTACPTAAPALATDGIKVRPGTRAHTFYASGTPTMAALYVRSNGGNWRDTGEVLDFGSTPVISRTVTNSGDRLALKADAVGMNIEIDAEVEVG
jgi:hypothetical protein